MDSFIEQKLLESLKNHGFEAALNDVAVSGDKIRLGAVIDYLDRSDDLGFIVIGRCRLNLQTCVWEGEQQVRLTEKEVALLHALYDACGEVVDRDVILDCVWGYHKDVETHTLETHIYRLRQKIERDPSEPEILKTAENGYYLSAC